jgi:glycine cleavage system H protein
MSDKVPSGLKYTKDHEWAKVDGNDVVIGITSFAVEQLGDITLVNLDVKAGDSVEHGKAFGTIESVKTLSDLFAPLSGKISKLNGELEAKPELVNEDCYGKGWMVVITAPGAKLDDLMDERAYAEFLKTASH